jgi:hypothetical protein
VLKDLAECRNEYRVAALEALAKHYEHREKAYAAALECIRTARVVEDSPELAHRQARLERRISHPLQQRLPGRPATDE